MMMRRSSLIFAGIMTLSAAAFAQACSASGGGDDGFTDASTGNDGGGGTTDGATDGGAPTDAGKDGATPIGDGACVFTPPSEVCGIFPQCGCAGTTCDFVPDGGDLTACTTSVGTAVGGAACTTSNDCAQGLTCAFGRCRPFCDSPGVVCTGAQYSLCHDHLGVAAFNICGIACDLADAGSCGGTQGCVAVGAGSATTTECENVGSGASGATCANPIDCQRGLDCVITGASSTCAPFCKVSGGTCTTGSCMSHTPALTINGVEYGTCQ